MATCMLSNHPVGFTAATFVLVHSVGERSCIYVPNHVSYTAKCRSSMQHWRWYQHLSLLCILRAIASGSILRPPVKDPTVWPFGLGGSEGSRGGPGFFFLSRSSLKAPPRMVPPFFSSAVICMQMHMLRMYNVMAFRGHACL